MRVMVQDLWIRRAVDGTEPPSRVKRAISRARDLSKARVPEKFKTTRYGKGRRWRCRWFQPSPHGRIQRTRSFIHREDAEEFAAAMEDDVRRGRYRDPRDGQRAFETVANEWLKSKTDIRPSTRGRYEDRINWYLLPRWADSPIATITSDDIQGWVSQLIAGTYPVSRKRERAAMPLSPSSIHGIVKIVMRDILKYAVEHGWLQSNPVDSVRTPKQAKTRRMVILTPTQVEELANAAAHVGRQQDGTLIRFQAYVGTRINETLALRVGDLDTNRGEAAIRRTWSSTEHWSMRLAPPKNGKPRMVAIPRFLIHEMKPLLQKRRKDDYIFTSPKGFPVNVRTWRNRVWFPALKLAGLEGTGVTIHSLRHAYASLAISAGADVKTLQRQLGHSSARVTLDVYASLWPNRLNDVANAVGRMRSHYMSESNSLRSTVVLSGTGNRKAIAKKHPKSLE